MNKAQRSKLTANGLRLTFKGTGGSRSEKHMKSKTTNHISYFAALTICLLLSSCQSAVLPHSGEQGQEGYQSILLDINTAKRDQERQLKNIVLPNGLEVLLISDTQATQSSAAMSVGVGSLQDPEEHQGLAHFLEHMLFMGSQKYPRVDDFSEFVESHGGYSNAYTAPEETNYQLIVNHDAFEGALDRFAQFFIAPIFDAHYVERERQAVNSEHQKNVQNEAWRDARLINQLARQNHPIRKFSTGNLDTLRNATREVLLAFYEKHYSANLMKLVLKSNMSLSDMEKWVHEKFAEVPNHNLARTGFERDVFDFSQTPFLRIKPVTNRKSLSLIFEVPSLYEYLDSKPHYFLASLLGHEGQGSLLSLLKREDLATGLSTDVDASSYSGRFEISINLSEKGEGQTPRIISHVYAYVDMLKKEGLKKFYHDEIKTLGEVQYVFRTPSKGTGEVEAYASAMHLMKALEIDRKSSLYYQHVPKDFSDLLALITPRNMLVVYVSPDVKTDQKELYYGAEYRLTAFDEAQRASWQSTTTETSFVFPKPNPFIPQDLSIKTDDPQTVPYKVVDDERGVFWFMQDKALHVPRAKLAINLLTDRVNGSPRDKLLSVLYREALYLSLVEWSYPMVEAGLGFSVDRADRGINLTVEGYSDKIPLVTGQIIKRLKDITIDEKQFAGIKVNFRRLLDSWPFSPAHQQASYHASVILSQHDIHKDMYPPVEEITLDEVKKFASGLYDQVAIEAVAYGNLTGRDLTTVVADLYADLQANILPQEKRIEDEMVQLNPGEAFYYVPPTKSDNNSWLARVAFGPRSADLKAYLFLADAYLQTAFFTEMRSQRQLGYLVQSGLAFHPKALGMSFVIQSGEYDPVWLEGQVLPWLKETARKIASMPDELFETYRLALIERLKEKYQTVDEWFGYVNSGALIEKGDFAFREKIIASLQRATKKELGTIMQKAMDDDTRRMLSVYVLPPGKEISLPKKGVRITDIAAFKKDLPVY